MTGAQVALLVSVPLAVYGFNADQLLLVPAVLQLVAWLWRRELSLPYSWVVGGGLLLVYGAWFGMLFVRAVQVHWYALAPLALAGVYAVAWAHRRSASAAV